MHVNKSADLGWGQRYVWLRHQHLPPAARHEAHIVISFELPPGVSLAGLRATLNYLVRRHEALRTTYHFDLAADPQQRVQPPSALPVTVVSTERDGTETPAEAIERLSTTEFDLAEQWPIRACVLTAGGRPKQLITVLNHMAFDAWTVDRFEREIEALGAGIAAGRPAVLEPIRHQPCDLAQYESSPRAVAIKDGALAYWRDEIATMPADTFALRRTADPSPTARAATLTSPAMLDASRRVAARHHVWPSLVHLATHAMVLAAYTGSDRVAHLSFTGNRDANPYNDVMTCMFSPLLMQVDCSGNPSFSEVVRRTAERFEQGQAYANVPYDELVELTSRESFRRGQIVRTGSELNFLSHAAHASRARRTTFTWNATPTSWAHFGADTYFRIYEMRDAVVIALNAVSTVMDADTMERFLRGYEAVLLAQADPDADLRVDDIARLIGFAAPATPARHLDRNGAIDLAEVAAVLREHPAVADARVAVDGAGRLVAELATDLPVTPANLRGHVLGRLHDRAAVRCPDWFRVTPSGQLPVVEGDGRLSLHIGAIGEAERALAAIVAEVNGLREVSLADSYTIAGGRVLRIPRVLAVLREHGWEGITVHQLAGSRPLGAVASLLNRTAVPASLAA
ncbi:condensation domain-containing protein [Allocatelliglobosispora scoriae]|nr:condensation domain-containing protein [Allocatelliglobosispora scoriae]